MPSLPDQANPNLVVFERIAARDWAALISGRLLIAEGRVEREVEQAEVPITHVIVGRLVDRSDLLNGLTDVTDPTEGNAWIERALGRADEVRRPEPGSQQSKTKLPGSRDFR